MWPRGNSRKTGTGTAIWSLRVGRRNAAGLAGKPRVALGRGSAFLRLGVEGGVGPFTVSLQKAKSLWDNGLWPEDV